MTTTVAILGGGISGLSCAYYLRQKFGTAVRPIIIERTNRCGGWVKTVHRGGLVLETGARTLRPAGLSGLNTLDMVEDLGMDDGVLFMPKYHPAAQNRFIYKMGELVKFPMDLKPIFKTTPPFDQPLIHAAFRDIFGIRRKDDDDSVYNFVNRRFGEDIAEFVFDPVIRGTCGGDSKRISARFSLAQMYEMEQKYGSVILGYLIRRIFKRNKEEDMKNEVKDWREIGFSALATTSVKEDWSVWALEKGLESLVERLEHKLVNEMDITILKEAPVKRIVFAAEVSNATQPPPTTTAPEIVEPKKEKPQTVVYHCRGENNQLIDSTKCDYVISTIPAWRFAKILRKSKPHNTGLWQILNVVPSADMLVTNLVYKGRDIIPEHHNGFGFLVPSCEIDYTSGIEGLMGVVFDTCAFPQGDNTILTVMSRPNQQIFDAEKPGVLIMEIVEKYLKKTMGIRRKPDDWNISFSSECIPQYVVGHYEKMAAARKFIQVAKMPLILCGASYDGISINDCIYSGRRAAEKIKVAKPH